MASLKQLCFLSFACNKSNCYGAKTIITIEWDSRIPPLGCPLRCLGSSWLHFGYIWSLTTSPQGVGAGAGAWIEWRAAGHAPVVCPRRVQSLCEKLNRLRCLCMCVRVCVGCNPTHSLLLCSCLPLSLDTLLLQLQWLPSRTMRFDVEHFRVWLLFLSWRNNKVSAYCRYIACRCSCSLYLLTCIYICTHASLFIAAKKMKEKKLQLTGSMDARQAVGRQAAPTVPHKSR